MVSKTLTLEDTLTVDDIGREIARNWQLWSSLRQNKMDQWTEVRKYKYAVDTTTTTNSKLPWKNKTTRPKLTQIADNLWSNYYKALFPKRRWLIWEGYDKDSNLKLKRSTIENYMMNVVERSEFQKVVGQLLDDWITYGNVFVMPEWVDERVEVEGKLQVGYVGPKARRVSPLDIVFNPIAPSFQDAPKIIRKFITLGDLKDEIENLSPTPEEAEGLWNYLKELRNPASPVYSAESSDKDTYLQVDGFTNYTEYLGSDYAEVLTFYGDLFIRETGQFYKNHIITVVDRHKVIGLRPNESWFGKPAIYHSGWRTRQDNLWGMGPLDNLIGLQYRIDHLENLKADVMDFNTFPMQKIRGYVEDYEWEPGGKIFVGDEGDVELMHPDWQILNAELEIDNLQQEMEEMAGAPKEAMGFRTPGEKTKYEVQRLENAAGRMFQVKLDLFESQIIEPVLTAMLEMARRKVTSEQLRIFDEETKVATFHTLTPRDITGNGRLRPVAARHFAEQSEKVQNATAFFNSNVGMDPAVNLHFSGVAIAQMFEDLLDISGYKLVTPYIRVSEQQKAESLMNTAQEQNMMEINTPGGLEPDDVTDPELLRGR